MKQIVLVLTLLILIISCDNTGKVDKWKEYWITGTLTMEKWGTDTIFFHDCYCNLIDSQVKINYVYFGGMHGGHLTAIVSSDDSVKIELSYMLHDFRTFSYDTKQVIINQPDPKLGETITGSIAVKGESQSRLKEIYKFDLKGNFKCILRDSTYEYESFYQDFLEHQDSLDMVKLKSIAYSNPDSVAELWLKYKHFSIIKDDLNRFRNLQKLALSDFPTLDGFDFLALKKLRELSINSDSLKTLPNDMFRIQTLEVLEIRAPITFVPHLYKMTELNELDLAATNVSQISDSITQLSNLHILNLSYTNIKEVPEQVFHLEHLVKLDLPETLKLNEIKTWKLNSLQHLDVPYDYLMYNKQIIKNLSNLDWLYISDNCSEDQDCFRIQNDKERYFEGLLPKVSIQVHSY